MVQDQVSPRQRILDPADSCFLFLVDELGLMGTVERALTALPLIPVLIELTKRLDLPSPMIDRLDTFARMTQLPVEIAKQRESDGLRTLHSNLCVSFWAAIESTVEETLANLLMQFPEASSKAQAQVGLRRLPNVTDRDSAGDFVQRWERTLGQGGATNVVERMTLMLGVLDIVVDLTESDRRRLTELSEFRNLAVHRRGVIDTRYLAKVPWCTLAVGTQFPLDRTTIQGFYEASTTFARGLMEQLLRSRWVAAAEYWPKPSANT